MSKDDMWDEVTASRPAQTPQSTFDEKLDEIMDSVLVGMYMRNPDNDFVPLDDKYNILRIEAREAIKALVLEEVVGADYDYKRDMPVPSPFDLPEDYINRWKAYQRSIITKGEEEL